MLKGFPCTAPSHAYPLPTQRLSLRRFPLLPRPPPAKPGSRFGNKCRTREQASPRARIPPPSAMRCAPACILGRNRRAMKASTLKMDRSRIETHIKPLLGARLVSGLTLRDIEGMQADVAAGKSARGRKAGRGGKSTGGSGVASRTVGTLRSLLGHAARLKVIGKNPAEGVRQLAVECPQRRLSDDELRLLANIMRTLAAEGETSHRPCRHPRGI